MSKRNVFVALLFLLTAYGAGCRSTRTVVDSQPRPLPLAVEVTYHAGTPLSGPVNEVVQLPAENSLQMYELRVMLLDHFNAAMGQPLSMHARLITSTAAGTAVLPATSITRRVRWLRDDVQLPAATSTSRGKATLQGHTQAGVSEVLLLKQATLLIRMPVLATDVTVAVKADASGDDHYQRLVEVAARRVTVMQVDSASPGATKGVEMLRMAVAVTDESQMYRRSRRAQRNEERATQGRDNETNGRDNETTKIRSLRADEHATETLVVDLPFDANDFQGSVILPFEIEGTPWHALVVSLVSTQQTATTEFVESVNTSLAQEQQMVAARPTFASKDFVSSHTDLMSAFALLDSRKNGRAALIYLAGRTGAKLTGNLALVSDDLLLELFAKQIKSVTTEADIRDAAVLGWLMDHACLKLLVEQSGQRVIRETQGVMAGYLGEVARRPATLQELVEESKTREMFDTRLQAENVISLEDDVPSTRVRAFNWLRRRNMAPIGFDPLASAQARREALEKVGASAAETSPELSEFSSESIPMLQSLTPEKNESTPAANSESK